MAKEEKTPSFYDVFQIGIELEGEFKNNPENGLLDMWNIGIDNTIEEQHKGYCNELRTGVIASEREEWDYLNDLQGLLKDCSNQNFAYKNSTAGTHIHFSFRNKSGLEDEDLFVFDTLDFEKYFFKRYFSRFTRKKFLNRVRHKYCRATLWFNMRQMPSKRIVSKSGSGIFNIEETVKVKVGSDNKYLWITMYGIQDNKGAEIRIYPHIQSVAGLKAVLNFTKNILISYLFLKKTQKRLKELALFHDEVINHELNPDKLNEFEKIALSRLKNYTDEGLFHKNVCGDTKFMLVNLFKRKRKAFEPLTDPLF